MTLALTVKWLSLRHHGAMSMAMSCLGMLIYKTCDSRWWIIWIIYLDFIPQ